MMSENQNRVRRRSGYTSVPNSVMGDMRLTIEARGLLALLMTFSDSWVFRVAHIQKQCGAGKDKYYRMIGELKDAGYLIITKTKDASGRFDGAEWEIIDAPKTAPCPEKPTVADPIIGKPDHIRENNSVRENNIKNPHSPQGGGLFGDDVPEQEPPDTTEQDFETFWAVYPSKSGKQNARKAFEKALKKVPAQRLIEAAKRYANWLKSGGPKDFRPHAKHAQGWLNGGRWDDDVLKDTPCAAEMDPERAKYRRIAQNGGLSGGARQ